MNQRIYFKISEVAKLTNISRQTLIYYDKRNILKPAFVDDNGYRYYDVAQIHQVQIINMLKLFDIPLNDIKFYLDNRDSNELLELFTNLQQELTSKLRETELFLSIITEKKDALQKSMAINNYQDIVLEMKKETYIFCGETLTVNDQNGAGHFDNAYAMETKIKEHGLMGFGLNVSVDKDFLTFDYDNHISYFYITLNNKEKKLANNKIPAGLYAKTYHKGSHQTSFYSYRRLIQYINENNLMIDGNAYERNVLNFLTEPNDDAYLAEISIKVKTQV